VANIPITYRFEFDSGREVSFDLSLDATTLVCADEPPVDPPAWVALTNKQCALCPLTAARTASCPAAVNMAQVADAFKDCFAYEKATVTVVATERTYTKSTTIQEGLGALIGVIMATSGCPVLEAFKPMARLHLPFASLEETVFRMSTMYLLAQYFRGQRGLTPNWALDGLKKIYEDVGAVNRDFALRLKDAAAKDANVNALVNLDCFASMVSLALEDVLEGMQGYFNAYLSAGS
jgi:hypothetical protein